MLQIKHPEIYKNLPFNNPCAASKCNSDPNISKCQMTSRYCVNPQDWITPKWIPLENANIPSIDTLFGHILNYQLVRVNNKISLPDSITSLKSIDTANIQESFEYDCETSQLCCRFVIGKNIDRDQFLNQIFSNFGTVAMEHRMKLKILASFQHMKVLSDDYIDELIKNGETMDLDDNFTSNGLKLAQAYCGVNAVIRESLKRYKHTNEGLSWLNVIWPSNTIWQDNIHQQLVAGYFEAGLAVYHNENMCINFYFMDDQP